MEYVALDYLWEKVVTPLIAEAHDYVPKPVVLLAGGAKPADAKSSDDISWDGKSMTPPAANASVNEEEIVSEDEILDSELTEDELSSTTPIGRKVASAAGKK